MQATVPTSFPGLEFPAFDLSIPVGQDYDPMQLFTPPISNFSGYVQSFRTDHQRDVGDERGGVGRVFPQYL